MMKKDVYEFTSNEELLEATIMAYTRSFKDNPRLALLVERSMRIGFAVAQEDGWTQVAPVWLIDYRKEKKE